MSLWIASWGGLRVLFSPPFEVLNWIYRSPGAIRERGIVHTSCSSGSRSWITQMVTESKFKCCFPWRKTQGLCGATHPECYCRGQTGPLFQEPCCCHEGGIGFSHAPKAFILDLFLFLPDDFIHLPRGRRRGIWDYTHRPQASDLRPTLLAVTLGISPRLNFLTCKMKIIIISTL